jgi:hypothetical protein
MAAICYVEDHNTVNFTHTSVDRNSNNNEKVLIHPYVNR